ncbi:MAG: S49 family peptidase, partial [Candidatus Promineifilaceae bacterium]
MTAENKSRNIIRRGLSGIGQLWREIIYSIGRVRFAFGNGMRRIRRARLDYVIIPVGGSLPERSGPPRSYLQRFLPLPPRPMSMEALHRRFRLISEADNVGGVILVLGNITTGIATLQSLRRAVKRLQDAGKEVVVYTPMVDLGHYFVAVAADRIVIPPSANFEVLGLHADAFFLNDALNRVGVEAEVVQISPYKTGFDYMSKSDMSAEYREQIEWILDETYGYIIEAISAGRDMPAETVREIIDRAPYSAAEAQEHGLVDDVAYEDTLSRLLVHHETDQPPASQST